jgi:uncharacterized protein (PEP-CTERM system associated)
MVSVSGFCIAAHAQTADYFATPWIVGPGTGETAGSQSNGNFSATGSATSSRSNLYAQQLASSVPIAPPVIYNFDVGIDEIATDNVAELESHRIPDLSSLLSAGLSVSANTPRLTGVFAGTGFYRQNINDTDLNQFSEYAYGNGNVTILPDHLFVQAGGLIDDLSTLGGGVQNPLVQTSQVTHVYTLSGSPYLVSRVGDVGRNVLRYQIGQAWFGNDTNSVGIGGLNPAPPSASTGQTAREDFRMAGTVLPRLLSDVSMSGSEENSGNSAAGVLEMANGELINEYEITRWAALIGGAGYEYLHDDQVPIINGDNPVWDFGGRLKPNPDSSLLLVYGHHSGKSDFAGEFAWRLTPFTDLYAAYTDTFSTVQQSVISNSADSVLGPEGAVSGVSFDQSTIIGVLDDTALSGAPVGGVLPIGDPLEGISNYAPLQDGLFRTKILKATGRSIVDADSIVLTAYYVQQISLTPLFVPSSSTEGGNLTWSTELSRPLSVLATVGYAHITERQRADLYSGALGATYQLSGTLSLVARYDFIYRRAEPSSGGYLQNAVTIGLHKAFD